MEKLPDASVVVAALPPFTVIDTLAMAGYRSLKSPGLLLFFPVPNLATKKYRTTL
jgi:hypothetical protein